MSSRNELITATEEMVLKALREGPVWSKGSPQSLADVLATISRQQGTEKEDARVRQQALKTLLAQMADAGRIVRILGMDLAEHTDLRLRTRTEATYYMDVEHFLAHAALRREMEADQHRKWAMKAAQEALTQRHPEEYAELVTEHIGDTTPSETLEELAVRLTGKSRPKHIDQQPVPAGKEQR